MKGKHSALKGFSFKEISATLASEGFFPHHRNSTHMIFADKDGWYVTVPCSKREVNHMMTTVSLQRIKNHQCRRMSAEEYVRLKMF